MLVVPEITDSDRSWVEPVSTVEIHYALVRQSPFLQMEPGTAQHNLTALAHLAQQTRHYRFFGGRDVLRHPSRVAELFEPLLSAHD